jgi:hypothetical protein
MSPARSAMEASLWTDSTTDDGGPPTAAERPLVVGLRSAVNGPFCNTARFDFHGAVAADAVEGSAADENLGYRDGDPGHGGKKVKRSENSADKCRI